MDDGFLQLKVRERKFNIHIDTDPRILLLLLAFCEKNIVRYFVLVISMIPGIGIMSVSIVPVSYIVLLFMYIRKYGAHIYVREVSVVLFISSNLYVFPL